MVVTEQFLLSYHMYVSSLFLFLSFFLPPPISLPFFHVHTHIAPRNFLMQRRCNYSTGKRWTTAFLLSFTLGGFGVDRFYLNHWASACGKIITFGGLGVWSILDVILIGTGYLGPADGSAYIYWQPLFWSLQVIINSRLICVSVMLRILCTLVGYPSRVVLIQLDT